MLVKDLGKKRATIRKQGNVHILSDTIIIILSMMKRNILIGSLSCPNFAIYGPAKIDCSQVILPISFYETLNKIFVFYEVDTLFSCLANKHPIPNTCKCPLSNKRPPLRYQK